MASSLSNPSSQEPSPRGAPAPLREPDFPDPFLHDSDEEEDDDEVDEAESSEQRDGPSPQPATQEISISSPPPRSPAPPLAASINVNKDVPPPPPPAPSDTDDDDETEDDTPDIYLPTLVQPILFLPIPNTDPLSTLLSKYVPPESRPQRDITGDWQRVDFTMLVVTHSWRALARMARDRLVTTNPEDIALVLSLWYLRISSLARLRLFNQASAEAANLFSILHAPSILNNPQMALALERVLPFELEVLQARLKYWAGDHMGHLDALHALLRKCKLRARQSDRTGKDDGIKAMWMERGSRICLIIASQLVEMKDYAAAARTLEPLCRQPQAESEAGTSALHSAVARIYLQAGHLAKAREHLELANTGTTNADRLLNSALFSSAEGNWAGATEALESLLQTDPDNFAAVNDLAVALLSQGKVTEGIEVLEEALRRSPGCVTAAEPVLFNLSTLYELRSATAADKKRQLLIEVAKWSGDGLRTACLKLPAT